MLKPCLLCQMPNTSIKLQKPKGETYFECADCGFIFLAEEFRISAEAEKSRYQLHINSKNDLGYRQFLQPILDSVMIHQSQSQLGLDFGSGPQPVFSELLREQGYQINAYDPFFSPQTEFLNLQYDFIVCIEVIEHMYHPMKDLIGLSQMLKPNGVIYLKTELTDSVHDFSNWWYHRDPTHVGFFNTKCLNFLSSKLGLRFEMSKNFFTLKIN